MNKTIFEKIKEYFIYFMLYSIFGWCYEVFLEVVVYKWGFSNRGVLFGPYCPVYGFGALAFIFTLYPAVKYRNLKEKILFIPIIFFLSMLIATAIELVTSYICEFTLGSWPWQTYSSYKFNFQARIALSPSVRFGLGGLLFLYLIQPIFEIITKKLGKKGSSILFYIFLIILILDCIYTFLIK